MRDKPDPEVESINLAIRPVGLVVDDEPEPLLSAIEEWMRDRWTPWMVPEFVLARGPALNGEIFELAKRADFVLLDNRFKQEEMGRYKEGIEIGVKLVEKFPEMPVFFYTAFPDDWYQGGKQHRLRTEIAQFLGHPNVRSFEKGDMGDKEVVRQVCNDILAAAAEKLRNRASGSRALLRLLAADLVEDTSTVYRLDSFDRRKRSQSLLDLSSSKGEWIEVPTRLLINAGVESSSRDVRFRVIEFSSGQVVSYFMVDEAGFKIAPEVRDYLLGEE